MLAKVCSAAVNGIEAYPVEVEVNAGYGDTLIVIVGLPDAAVKESRDRVMTALIKSGFAFTFGRTTINLAPADVKKEGPSFDLPIAVGMVATSEQMESNPTNETGLDWACLMTKDDQTRPKTTDFEMFAVFDPCCGPGGDVVESQD